MKMNKLLIQFLNPPDVEDFEHKWSEGFVPLAERMPGLKRVSVSRIYGGPAGEVNLHLVHEFFFENAQSLRHAMSSPEGQRAGQALLDFASEYVTICFAEHLEEDRN
jgi:uncharacterized protein (TIGR02118 family)